MNTIVNHGQRLVSSNFTVSDELRTLNQEVSGKAGSFNVQFAAMKLSMLMIGANQDRLSTQLKDSVGNLNKLTAANQLKESTTALKATRSQQALGEGAEMPSNAADTKAMADKAIKGGITMTADEYKKWESGKVVAADIDTMEAKIKTMQDAASNQSQADNMNMQKLNTLISQFTNMGMTFLDEYKKGVDRVFR
jgi:hypothetical protein